MKKLIVMAAFAVAGLVNAQTGFKAGVHAGLPIGDAGNGTSFNFGVDASYLLDVADKFKVGGTVGYTKFQPKDGLNFNISFVTIGATAQYSFSENIFAGADLGYAVWVGEEGGKGGLFYLPKVGYQTEQYEVYLGYKGISQENTTASAIQLGFNYKF
jgi:hypothetical protein